MRAGPPGAPQGGRRVGGSRETPVERGNPALFLSAAAPGQTGPQWADQQVTGPSAQARSP